MAWSKIKTGSAALLLASLILFASATLYSYIEFQNIGRIKAGSEDPLEAWSEASYIVWKYNSTHYAARNMSTLLVDYIGTNASQIINNVIDASEGTVLLKGNTEYSLTGRIRLDDNTNLFGEGASTVIKQADSENLGWLIDNENHLPGGTDQEAMYNNNIAIENLAIDGNYAGQTSHPASNWDSAGIIFYVKNLVIRNLWIYNTGNFGGINLYSRNATVDSVFVWDTNGATYGSGIFLSNNTASILTTISNSHLSNIDGKGIYIEDGANDITIKGNTIATADIGIEFGWGDNTTISGNIIKSSVRYGIHLALSDGVSISNNVIRESGDTGIKIESTSTNWNIEGNQIIHNGWSGVENHGIHILSGNGTITGNTLIANKVQQIRIESGNLTLTSINSNIINGKNLTTGDGIIIINTNHVSMTGNTISDNISYGIVESGTSDYNVAVANIVISNTAGQIGLGGPNSVNQHNIVT